MKQHILTQACTAAYIRHLQEEERAGTTIQKYLFGIRAFACWLEGRPVTKENTTRWKAELQDGRLKPSTVNGRLSAVNGLCAFLGWEECQVRLLKIQQSVFRAAARELRREEYGRLVQTAARLRQGRLALLIETICATGIRVSEVRYITVEAARAGQATVSLKGKIRTILLPRRLCCKLLEYARKQKTASGEIFRTENGACFSRNRIWREMKALCAQAGVAPTKVFPHNLRRLFAVSYYQAYRDIVRLADILGHSSVNTTRIYLLTTGEEHARQLEQLGLVC